jgi:hypothetical protein
MKEKPQVVRSPEPRVGAARETEGRRIAEIAREIKELGPVLEGRDRLARFETAEKAKGLPGQVGQTAGAFSPVSGGALVPMGRAIEMAQDAYRRAVAKMHGLTARKNAEADAAGRKAAEEKLAAEAAARQEARQTVKERAKAEAAREMAEAQARAAAQEATKRQAAEDARLKTGEAACKTAEGKPKSDALAKEQAESAEVDLAQEHARAQALERQLAARGDEQKLLAQERARAQALERQLAARGDEQKLLAQERARAYALERQLATREDEQKLLAQERVRAQALEHQLATREDEQKLLAQERASKKALELQLAVREDTRRDRDRNAAASRSHRPASMPTAPEASDNLEAARLMAQARLLLDQGNIIAARSVLERAAESGSAMALFLLAETYDRASLSAWGISGRRGNVTKARELYAKAVVGGVHEAKYRLSVLH